MSNQSYHTDRNELIESHMNLVPWVINNLFFAQTQDVRDELTSIGYEALVIAADKFDSKRGEFASWAILNIRSAITGHFRKNYRRAEIAHFTSLDQQINEDDAGSMTYHEVFEDEDAQYEESTVSKMYVNRLLSCLGKRDRRFISLHLGLDEGSEPLSMLKLSKKRRVSYEKTRARRQTIISKLRESNLGVL